MKRFKKASDVKVGVVGYGGAFNMGSIHLVEMKGAGMTPVAVVDFDPSRLSAAKVDFPGVGTFGSLGAMLGECDVDLVVVVTPHNTHARLVMQALKAGKHVVCEKPLAITTAQCDAMIAAARKNKVMLTAYHNRHWDGCIMNAVKKVRSGLIGKVVRIRANMGCWGQPGDWWRSSKSISGGILLDWGVHLLEYAFQIIDSAITEVAGFAHRGYWAPRTAWKTDTFEDEGFAVVRFAGGAWMTLCVTQIDSNPSPAWMEITGTKGTFLFDEDTWHLITHNGSETVITKGHNPPSEGWRFYKNIAGHLTRGQKLVITPEWARRPIHVLDLADRSAAKGKALKAKYP